jgi:plasmid stabilization system protein ParE
MSIIFHRLAIAEFIATRRWYAQRSLTAESRFVMAINDAILQVQNNPQIGTLSVAPYRWIRLRKFPYLFTSNPSILN